MNGILNIDKPRGKTSFGVVAMVRRLSGERKVGHAGTLDPAAGGVLPVCLGRATRVTEYLSNDTKVYLAEIELGVTTDTYDAEGKVTGRCDPSGISLQKLESVLPSFIGNIYQVPPIYSALKYHGKPIYELARAGISVEMKSRPVFVKNIELKVWQPPVATMEITCGKGTYIRSLAHDIGITLGCGARMNSLVRTRCGIFDIRDSVTPDRLREIIEGGFLHDYLSPPDSVLRHLKAVTVDAGMEKDIRNGRQVSFDEVFDPGEESLCRAYSPGGDFLAILRLDSGNGRWQPEKVFV
jgi:tRNA pseudouridine55 synthase